MNNIALLTRLEKAAQDSGFDIVSPRDTEWLGFASSHCPLKIWLTTDGNASLLAAFSDASLSVGLETLGNRLSVGLPPSAQIGYSASTIAALYPLLKRAFQLSRALPSEPLKEFQKQIQSLPQSTEMERLVIQRVGQDIFRERLFEFWDGKCAVTGLSIPALLRASHIKPWSDCASDAERLDVFNGLLHAPHLDAVFDRGFVTFGDDGSLIVSKHLGSEGLRILGIDAASKCVGLTVTHQKYLSWHRVNIFKETR